METKKNGMKIYSENGMNFKLVYDRVFLEEKIKKENYDLFKKSKKVKFKIESEELIEDVEYVNVKSSKRELNKNKSFKLFKNLCDKVPEYKGIVLVEGGKIGEENKKKGICFCKSEYNLKEEFKNKMIKGLNGIDRVSLFDGLVELLKEKKYDNIKFFISGY